MGFEENDKNQKNNFLELGEKNNTYENYTGVIFGAGILIISFIVLLCLGWNF